MTVSTELVWLINQIRNTPQPRERLRLLALGWRTLKGLSPDDRRLVARELGFEGAEDLVEQLGRRGGASPSLLLEAISKAKSADPVRLGAMVRGLLDPKKRSESVDRLMDVAADWLAEEAGVPDSDESVDVEADVVEEIAVPPPPPLATAVSEVEEPVEAIGETALQGEEISDERWEVRDREGDTRGIDEKDAHPPREAAPDEETEAFFKDPEEVEAAGVADDRARPDEAKRVETPEERPATLDTEPPPVRPPVHVAVDVADIVPLTARIASKSALMARFRALAEDAGGLSDASATQLEAVVELFPAGWARRRAIETLFRAGAPQLLHQALALIDTLERPAERMWAFTTLVASRELDEDERIEVLAAAGSPAIERRLRLRLS